MDRELPKLVKGEYPRRVIDHLTTAIVVLDDAMRLVFMNPAAEMLMGASLRQNLGVCIRDVFGDDSVVYAGLEECLANGHPYTEREVSLNVHGSQPVTVDLTVTAMQEPGLPDELLIEMRQVDRRIRIAREENLISQYNATRALVRGLAHEIKNPLGGIRGAAQLLEQESGASELREYTTIVIREADRLRKLVDHMLGPNALPRRRPVNIHEVLEQVRGLVEAETRAGLIIQRDYDPSIPPLMADSDQLVQALLNVVRNAVQATNGKGTIVLRTRVLRQYTIGPIRHKLLARIDIQDDGPGVGPGMAERMFMPMVTSRTEGTGLGLSIAQNLINQHQGLIECTSQPGRTTFTILLPVEESDEHTE
jgi:two-component system nitrogen regulation sensor histidine kinase GlnL